MILSSFDLTNGNNETWRASALGMTTEFHHTGPNHRIGYSMERRVLAEGTGPTFKREVVKLLSHREMPGDPE